MALPLVVRKKIRDSEPFLKEHLEKIKNAVGKEFEFEADWANSFGKIEGQNAKDNLGEIYQKHAMEYISNLIVSTCKDEMAKEAFSEATSANKIVIRCNPALKGAYWQYVFENGAFIAEHNKTTDNVYELGRVDLAKIIPVPGLPLPARLNIEKNRPKLDEYLEQIATLTGTSDWAVEIEFDNIVTKLPVNYQNNIGDTYYKQAMDYIYNSLKNALAAETTKEAFNEATSQHKIVFQMNEKQKEYWSLKFVDGALVYTHKNPPDDLYEIGRFNVEDLIPSPGLPLPTRLNIEQNREKVQELLDKISQLTGESDWSVEPDYENLVKAAPNQQKNVGSLVFQALDYLANSLKNALASETTREAFNEATTQHKITFVTNPKQKEYWTMKFDNGGIVLTAKGPLDNLYEIGRFNIEDLIPSPGLPLPARLNIEQYKEKLEEYLEQINQLTGQQDWCVEADFDAAVKNDPTQVKRIGQTYYKDALDYWVNNLKNTLKSETTKEAFNEATSQKKVIYRINPDPKAPYWHLLFENGAIVLQHRKNIDNMYEIGRFDIAKATPVPGVMTLVSRLSLESSQEKLKECLDKITAATGEEFTFDDACIESFYPSLSQNAKNNIGNLIKQAVEYVANSLEKNMQDEMVKEAFNETVTAHQITIRFDAKQKEYWTMRFENGAILLTTKSPELDNLYEIGRVDIEKML